MTQRTCLRCGHVSDRDVRMKLVHYPGDKKPYGAEWRCSSLKDCDARFHALEEAET